MNQAFWSTLRELLIIVLGIVMVNAFAGFLQSDASGSITTNFTFDIKNIFMTWTFLLIVFRFGYANIMFAEELSREPAPDTTWAKVNHLVTFMVLFLSAVILSLMSYYVNWKKYGAAMYVWFLVLCFIDSIWDLVSWYVRRQQTFRLAWLANKVAYILFVLLIFWVFSASFNPLSPPPPPEANNNTWLEVFLLLIIMTWVSSAISIYVGRQVFFPFLFPPPRFPPLRLE